MKSPFVFCGLLLAALSGAHAATFSFASALAPEAAGATGSGSVFVEYDDVAHTLAIDAQWSGLSGTTTVAHIHCCTAVAGLSTIGVAVTPGTLPSFPVGVTSGEYSTVLDLTSSSTYTAAFVTNFGGGTTALAEAALIQGFYDGKAYFNVHSTTYGSGEIRGFLQPVPEPGTYALMALGLVAVVGAARRKA